jgi:hypothetical protein
MNKRFSFSGLWWPRQSRIYVTNHYCHIWSRGFDSRLVPSTIFTNSLHCSRWIYHCSHCKFFFLDWIWIVSVPLIMNALSFYRSQNVLCQSKFFVSDQKFIYILCQTKRWFAFSKIGSCAGTKVFEEALNAVKFLDRHKTFWDL